MKNLLVFFITFFSLFSYSYSDFSLWDICSNWTPWLIRWDNTNGINGSNSSFYCINTSWTNSSHKLFSYFFDSFWNSIGSFSINVFQNWGTTQTEIFQLDEIWRTLVFVIHKTSYSSYTYWTQIFSYDKGTWIVTRIWNHSISPWNFNHNISLNSWISFDNDNISFTSTTYYKVLIDRLTHTLVSWVVSTPVITMNSNNINFITSNVWLVKVPVWSSNFLKYQYDIITDSVLSTLFIPSFIQWTFNYFFPNSIDTFYMVSWFKTYLLWINNWLIINSYTWALSYVSNYWFANESLHMINTWIITWNFDFSHNNLFWYLGWFWSNQRLYYLSWWLLFFSDSSQISNWTIFVDTIIDVIWTNITWSGVDYWWSSSSWDNYINIPCPIDVNQFWNIWTLSFTIPLLWSFSPFDDFSCFFSIAKYSLKPIDWNTFSWFLDLSWNNVFDWILPNNSNNTFAWLKLWDIFLLLFVFFTFTTLYKVWNSK